MSVRGDTGARAPSPFFLLVFFLVVSAAPARAQRIERMEASFTTGASLGDGGTALALTAGLGFHFTSLAGIAVEAAYARKLDFMLDLCPPPRVCVLGGRLPVTGRVLALLPQLTVDLVQSRRARVYVQAGIGAGHVRQRYWFPAPPRPTAPNAVEFTRSSLSLAFAYGGGVATRIVRRVDMGADVRWLHLRGEARPEDEGLTPSGTLESIRLGTRVSWRF